MATMLVSFRLKNDRNYSDRYESVVNSIRREAEGGTTWEEMTSIFVFKSNRTAEAICSSIYLGSLLSPSIDSLIVVNASEGKYATKGDIEYPATLASMFSTSGTQDNSLRTILGG